MAFRLKGLERKTDRPPAVFVLDQGVLLETAANLPASRRKANDFFAVFFFSTFNLGGITVNT